MASIDVFYRTLTNGLFVAKKMVYYRPRCTVSEPQVRHGHAVRTGACGKQPVTSPPRAERAGSVETHFRLLAFSWCATTTRRGRRPITPPAHAVTANSQRPPHLGVTPAVPPCVARPAGASTRSGAWRPWTLPSAQRAGAAVTRGWTLERVEYAANDPDKRGYPLQSRPW
jgi:hypothetical protein